MAEEPTPLADVRVVEWTSGLAGAYAGFLLAGGIGATMRLLAPHSREP